MKSFPRQRVIVLTLLYCCATALICGVWSTRFGSSEDSSLLSSSQIWSAGARSLTSTEEETQITEEGTQVTEETTEETTQSEEELDLQPDLQSSLPQLYHTPQVFALNYKEMTENLRVYVYPNSHNASYEYDVTSDEPIAEEGFREVRFFNLLAEKPNAFVTHDPEEAQLFYLPVSFDALVTKLGPAGVGHHLRHYLQFIRDNFSFWDRSLGSDHFYLSNGAFESFNHRNNLEFTKNAIQVACSPLHPQQLFYPHKDIALPSYQSGYDGLEQSPQRSHLAYVGMQFSSPPAEWTTDAEFLLESNSSEASDVLPKLRDAKFCVSDSMRNVVDALRAGCVPVLVSDSLFYDLPFPDILNWHEFAVLIGTAKMANLKTVLTSMPAGKYEKMQYLGLQASKHMEWNDPPAAYDAFHMTLFQLWIRRHSVKYARRADS